MLAGAIAGLCQVSFTYRYVVTFYKAKYNNGNGSGDRSRGDDEDDDRTCGDRGE